MSFAKGTGFLNHLIMLTCFSALIVNDHFHWGWSLLGMGILAASLYITSTDLQTRLSSRFWNGLSLLFFLVFWIDFLWLSRALLPASMHFLVYLMAYRLFHLERSKDDLQLYLIGFLQLLAAAGEGSHFGFAISFSLACSLLVWGLLVQHFKAEQEAHSPTLLDRPFKEVIPYPFFLLTSLLSFSALFLTLLIFLLIPRIGIGFFKNKESSPQKISGFSERVDLGSMGLVKLDPSLVMRVIPERDEPQSPFYLRGTSFDTYDGQAWKNTLTHKTTLEGKFDRTFEIASTPEGRPLIKKLLIKRTIFLEPLETPVLFTFGFTSTLRGSFQNLSQDLSGTLYLPSLPLHRVEYEVNSMPALFSELDQKINRIDYPDFIRAHYLPIEASPNIVALAQEITAPFSTLYQKAQAIEDYLKTNYTYSLEVAPSDRPPLEDFLFFQKKGYCEYYASAMVVMLRSIGIASRLVTGFLPGEWNEFGHYYLVRQSDAHAWVEVYFPEEKWLSFDPTPLVPLDRSPLFTTVAAYVDWMHLKWDRYIVRYSLLDQFAFLQKTREQFGTFSGHFGNSVGSFGRFLQVSLLKMPLPFGTLLLLLGIMVLLLRKERAIGGRGDPDHQKALTFYKRMLRILAKKGYIKKESQTPFEFLEKAMQSTGRPIKGLQAMTEIYCQVRFGGKVFSDEEARHIELLLSEMKALNWRAIRGTQDEISRLNRS